MSGPGGGDFFSATINTSDPAINSILTTGGPAGVGRALNSRRSDHAGSRYSDPCAAGPLPIVSLNAQVTGGSAISIRCTLRILSCHIRITSRFPSQEISIRITRSICVLWIPSDKSRLALLVLSAARQSQSESGQCVSQQGTLRRAGKNPGRPERPAVRSDADRSESQPDAYADMALSVPTSSVRFPSMAARQPMFPFSREVLRTFDRAFAASLANGDFATVMQNLYNFQAANSLLQALAIRRDQHGRPDTS